MKISAFLLLLAASISGNHDGSGGGVTAAAEALGLSDGEENVHKNENCETLNITAISIMFQVNTPMDVDISLCNEMYTVTPRCPGSTDIVSSPVVVDLGTGRNTTSGSYNIADTYTAATSATKFVRIGHGSFVFPNIGSLYVQSYQECSNDMSSVADEECYTRIAITGGDGRYECAQGHVDFFGTNSETVITYIANFCNTCRSPTTSSSSSSGASGNGSSSSNHYFISLLVAVAVAVAAASA